MTCICEIQVNNLIFILMNPFIIWNPKSDISIEEVCSKNIIWIVVSHWHQDHMGDAVEIAQKTNATIISTFELSKYFSDIRWVKDVHAMHIWWEHDFGDYKVKLTNAAWKFNCWGILNA